FARWEGSLVAEDDSTGATLVFAPDSDVWLKAVFTEDDSEDGQFPVPLTPHKLADGNFTFDYWSPTRPELTFPESMYFTQSTMNDPGLDDPVDEVYYIPEHEYSGDDSGVIGFPYNTTSRTRISGLDDGGIGFINTGRGRDLGAAVLV